MVEERLEAGPVLELGLEGVALEPTATAPAHPRVVRDVHAGGARYPASEVVRVSPAHLIEGVVAAEREVAPVRRHPGAEVAEAEDLVRRDDRGHRGGEFLRCEPHPLALVADLPCVERHPGGAAEHVQCDDEPPVCAVEVAERGLGPGDGRVGHVVVEANTSGRLQAHREVDHRPARPVPDDAQSTLLLERGAARRDVQQSGEGRGVPPQVGRGRAVVVEVANVAGR